MSDKYKNLSYFCYSFYALIFTYIEENLLQQLYLGLKKLFKENDNHY
jgi:hypothetical protein